MGMDRIPRKSIEDAKKLVGNFFKDESSSGTPPSLEGLAKSARTALAAGAILSGGTDVVEAKDARGSTRIERAVQSETLSEKEIDILALNVFHEARGEPTKGQLAVVQVTLARVLSKKFSNAVEGVVYAKNQFSWTGEPKSELKGRDKEEFENLRAVLSMYAGGKPIQAAIAELAQVTNVPIGAHFYKRADYDENNPEETRLSDRSKKFFRSLQRVATIGQHAFYTERTRMSKK